MKLEIFDIQSLGEGQYSIGLRVSGTVQSYVLEILEDPIVRLSAPDSFWLLLRNDRRVAKEVFALVMEYHNTGATAVPHELRLTDDDIDKTHEDLPWVSRMSAWYLSRESVTWALQHLATRGNNTLFPLPFEHQAILSSIDEFSPQIQRLNICKHEIKDFRQLWVPKSTAGRRHATQLDPLDAAVLTAITYEIGQTIESTRIPTEEGIVFGFRFLPTMEGSIWDERGSYDAFQTRSWEILTFEEDPVVIETDIASFYHSIDLNLISSILERIGVRRKSAEALKSLLMSSRIEGLPVGPSVSALFADTVLTPIDQYLLSIGAKFVRFNDDYRFFCRNEIEAQSLVGNLSDVLLRTAGLLLRNEKTRIWSREDFLKRVQPNWLTELYVEESDVDDPNNEPDFARRITSARSVLEKAIDESHVAYVDLCRKAFKALPLEEKSLMMPKILEQLGRVWVIAPQVSRSLEALLVKDGGGEDLVRLVSDLLNNRSQNLQDYTASWLLHAFRKKEWKGKEALTKLDDVLTEQQNAARRELLIALQHTSDVSTVSFDPLDPWQGRAHVWATRHLDRQLIPQRSDARAKWVESLYYTLLTAESNV